MDIRPQNERRNWKMEENRRQENEDGSFLLCKSCKNDSFLQP